MGFTTLTLVEIFLLSLATWRLSYMLVEEQGPAKVFNFMRYHFPLGGVWRCIYCTSIWVAIGLDALYRWGCPNPIDIFALSGLAMILRAYTGAGIHDNNR